MINTNKSEFSKIEIKTRSGKEFVKIKLIT